MVGVDGDFRVRESIVRLAESAGYAPLVFPSAEALLQSGALREAACLITDVRMPGMDGLELLRRVSAELMPRGPWWNGMGNLARGARSEHDEESHARQAMVVVFLGAIVPVAEPDLGCGDEMLGGECARKGPSSTPPERL